MKNYMANKTFSRGIETLGAEASIAFVGNTMHSVPQMLKNSNLFEQLPAAYLDSAFIDRIHNYIPGWEVNIIRGEMFTSGYGFIIDYLSEALHGMRELDFTGKYKDYYTLSSSISTRDRDGVQKTFSGLMKILFPSGEATKEEICELLKLSVENRKRVKDQLFRIDPTYDPVDFSFTDNETGERIAVQTLEEVQYPALYVRGGESTEKPAKEVESAEPPAGAQAVVAPVVAAAPTVAREEGLARGTGMCLGAARACAWMIDKATRRRRYILSAQAICSGESRMMMSQKGRFGFRWIRRIPRRMFV